MTGGVERPYSPETIFRENPNPRINSFSIQTINDSLKNISTNNLEFHP